MLQGALLSVLFIIRRDYSGSTHKVSLAAQQSAGIAHLRIRRRCRHSSYKKLVIKISNIRLGAKCLEEIKRMNTFRTLWHFASNKQILKQFIW